MQGEPKRVAAEDLEREARELWRLVYVSSHGNVDQADAAVKLYREKFLVR